MPVGPLLLFGNQQAANPGASILTLYCADPIVSGGNAGTLQTTTPPASTSTTGWTVGTVASGNYSRQSYNNEVPVAGFSTTVQPATVLLNAGQDAWRYGPLTGQFSLGTWYSSLSVIGVTSGGDQDGRVRLRLWRSRDASGSSTSAIASDGFGRADAATPGGNYVLLIGIGSHLGIFSNQVDVSVAASRCADAYDAAIQWPANQYAQVRLPVLASSTQAAVVRGETVVGAQRNYYAGGRSPNDFGDSQTHIWKEVNNVITNLAASGTVDIAAGDTISLEVVGSALVCKVNGVRKVTVADSAFTQGKPAMLGQHSAIDVAILDDFEAGAVVVATEVTNGTMVGTTVTNLSTTVAQSSAASQQISAFPVAGEYLFLQPAWEITGVGGAVDRDVLVRYGSIGVTDGSGLITAAFRDDTAPAVVGLGSLYYWYNQAIVEDLI